MTRLDKVMICTRCKHYAKAYHYCCAEHKTLPAIAVPVTCTAFAPHIASNRADQGARPETTDTEKTP